MLKQEVDIGQNTEQIVAPTRQLRLLVKEVLTGNSDQSNQDPVSFVSVRLPVGALDPFQWVKEQRYSEKIVWQDRESGSLIAGVGVTDSFDGDAPQFDRQFAQRIARLRNSSEDLKYFGGIRFDRSKAPHVEWSAFRGHRFILPRFELRQHEGRAYLHVNLDPVIDRKQLDRIQREIDRLTFPMHPLSGSIPMPISRSDRPKLGAWKASLEKVLLLLRHADPLEKIVLARQVVFDFAERIDRFLLIKLLGLATPQCYHFLFQFDESSAFVGATPERLYRRRGRHVESEAVAGTGRRDQGTSYDQVLGDALLSSDKDQREHAFVRTSLIRSFKSLCSQFSIDAEASLMNISIGRHLRSKFKGVLRDEITDAEVLNRVPPTSAVGGHPRQLALQKIQDIEPFDRGWYAGAVGWFGRNEADFGVAIRSGIVSENRLRLYSGAGIVDGSDAEQEWAEIEQKIGDFINVLGLDQKRAKY